MAMVDTVFWLPIGGPVAQAGLLARSKLQRSVATWRRSVFIA